jgi:hypothetical protein
MPASETETVVRMNLAAERVDIRWQHGALHPTWC